MVEPRASERPATSEPAPSFGRLARRISSWTSRLLLSAVVVVAALAFGRQVVLWWHQGAGDTPPAAPPTVPPSLGDPAARHAITFGDQPWTVERQDLAGDAAAAADRLRQRCRGLTRDTALPPGDAGPGETTLLERLAGQTPLDAEPGRWKLYDCPAQVPMAVGLKRAAPAGDPPEGSELATAGLRVVTWGLAVPLGPERWALYTFRTEQHPRDGTAALPEVPLPPGTDHVMTLRLADGSGTRSFRGDGPARRWCRFYDAWLAGQGWPPAAWRRNGEAWFGSVTAGAEGAPAAVTLWFGPDRRGGCRGVIVVGPGPAT